MWYVLAFVWRSVNNISNASLDSSQTIFGRSMRRKCYLSSQSWKDVPFAMQMEPQACFWLLYRLQMGQSIWTLQWFLSMWTSMNQTTAHDPKWPCKTPKSFHASRENWIILSQLGYFMTSLKLISVSIYDLDMTGKYRFKMTPYDRPWLHMAARSKTKKDHGESKIVSGQKNATAKVCPNLAAADYSMVKEDHLFHTRKMLVFQQYGELS